MVRSMHAVMNCVVMKVGGTEGIPKTGRAKPFITTTDILCSGGNFVIFLDRDSHGLINELQTKEKYKSAVSMTSKESFLSLV